jgi:hypothetical protein
MEDDVALLQTRAVADRAVSILHLNMNADRVLSRYKGTAVSPSIMSIKLSGSSAADAVAQSNALAAAFFQIRSSVLNQQTQVLVSGLQTQINSVKAQIQQLTTQINALPATPTDSQATQKTNLVNERNSTNTQLLQLQAQVQQDQLSEASITQGSRVLDPAVTNPVSKKKVVAKDALSGLVAGLGLGFAIVVIGALVSDRLRRRAEVAAALGAPVELSVGHLPRPRWLSGIRLRRHVRRPSAALQMVERRLRTQLEAAPSARLAVIEIEAGKPAALATTVLAVSLASEGKRVMLVDAAHGRPLAAMLGATPAAHDVEMITISRKHLALFVVPDDPGQMVWTDSLEDADVILTLATVDPALGAEHISTWARDAVVIVRAGTASAVQIDAVGRLLHRALIAVPSAILIEADRDDYSAGIPASEQPDDPPDRSLRAVKGNGR